MYCCYFNLKKAYKLNQKTYRLKKEIYQLKGTKEDK